jgi:hypothetical protein
LAAGSGVAGGESQETEKNDSVQTIARPRIRGWIGFLVMDNAFLVRDEKMENTRRSRDRTAKLTHLGRYVGWETQTAASDLGSHASDSSGAWFKGVNL